MLIHIFYQIVENDKKVTIKTPNFVSILIHEKPRDKVSINIQVKFLFVFLLNRPVLI